LKNLRHFADVKTLETVYVINLKSLFMQGL